MNRLSDEHIHTELMTTEGMTVWSFQRSLVHGMTARRDGEVVSTEPGTEAKAAWKSSTPATWSVWVSAQLEPVSARCRTFPLRKLPLIADKDLTGVTSMKRSPPLWVDLVAAGDSCLDGKPARKSGTNS